jgi:single-stranded-DNA-specific exonuclease
VTFSDLNLKLLQMLDSLEPIGMGNPTPIFATYGVRVLFSKKMGSDFSHLKFRVSDGYLSFDAVAFQMGYLADMMPELVDLAFEFSLNEFRGKKTMQLIVRDIRPSTF